ncbi:hypothetical protein FACS189449_13010 [Alphaproteobacteria bacterium]|nr:hypothetical protein FACS189449_13010 [Alphaproteobacteria bacterium]
MQFNEKKFLTEVRRIYLNSEDIAIYDAIPDADVRAKLNEFVDYGDKLATPAVCRNPEIIEFLDSQMHAGPLLSGTIFPQKR